MGDLALRNLLDKIVSEKNSENWWRPELFEKNTLSQLPKSLIILQTPPDEERNYNCYIFAFGLQDHAFLLGNEGWEYTKNLDKFIEKMIANGDLEKLDSAQDGAMVLYRTDGGQISHTGLINKEGRVISKWSWGPLLDHNLYDVPKSYGDRVEYYQGMKKGKELILKDFSQS